MGSLCTQKMLATAPQIARATLGRTTPLAHPNAPSRALYGPGVARPRPQRSHNLRSSACVLPTRPKASWDSFARKRCSQNMRHLKTLGRATNLSSIKTHHYIERHTGREWRIHPHMHRNTPHAYFGPAQTPPWTPLHSKRAHNIRHLRERAHLLDERAITSRPGPSIRMHRMSSAAPVLSGVLMHTPEGTRNAPHACFGHAKSVPRALCSHMVLAMAPLIARAHVFE